MSLSSSSQNQLAEADIIDGRSCGSCTLCCKVLSIEELDKPQGHWCEHCVAGRGCRIYENRPRECSMFYCGYLTWPMMGEHWFPAKSKMVIVSELEGMRIAIHVDPGRPGAWREAPYYDEIKRWSYFAAQETRQVVVCIGNRAIVILPHEDVDLGPIAADERIITMERRHPDGNRWEALKLKADDPRLSGMVAGKAFLTKLSR